MRLAYLHLPNITPFTRVSNIQQILTTHLLAHKKATSQISSASSVTSIDPLARPPDPTIITFTPNPVYTTGRRDLPPSNTFSPSHFERTSELSLPPSLIPIRSLLTPPANGPSSVGPVAEYHPTLRGGQTTYHGPGQLVAYTILDLRRLGLTPRCHIRLLENSVIDVLCGLGIQGFVTENPGVWVSGSSPTSAKQEPKKIAAVGVHLRRHISSYGIGLNITEEPMWFFRQIVACGLEGREATSLEGQGVKGVTVEEAADRFVAAFVNRLQGDFPPGESIDEVYKARVEDILQLEKIMSVRH
jgi:lipoate-protein ligase B